MRWVFHKRMPSTDRGLACKNRRSCLVPSFYQFEEIFLFGLTFGAQCRVVDDEDCWADESRKDFSKAAISPTDAELLVEFRGTRLQNRVAQ